MSWERFESRYGKAQYPRVTITVSKVISLNEEAYELLGRPERILFLYDVDRGLVGLKAASGDRRAYKPRRIGKAGRRGSYHLSGVAFLGYYGIQPDRSRAYATTLEDGILAVDLRGDSVEVVGPRSRPRSKRLTAS